MAKSTRFVTTISVRNLLHNGGFDGYYLDGRISGPRDTRMGETTLDREERGFFYAIYTNLGSDIKEVAFKNKKHLDRIFEDMKTDNKYNIDYEINELADCAVNVAGRPVLGSETSPYFSGLIVKDGEMAAITSGRGCAYLYRNDILYPLTNDEFPIADIDLNGNKVPNIDLYCAGVAGTIRYSNIAQLQPDDCFILTNIEVMETIGHVGLLRILDEAYDQQDVAAKVFDLMAERNPDAPAQFMIGLVDDLNTLDKAALRSMTSRMGWTQKTLNSVGGLSTLAEAHHSASAQAQTKAPAPSHVSTYESLQKEQAEDVPVAPSSVNAVSSKPYQETTRFDQSPLQYEQQNAYKRSHLSGATAQIPVVGYAPNRRARATERAKVEEEGGLTTVQKVMIGILFSLIILLLLAIGYMKFVGLPAFLKPQVTVPPTVEETVPPSTRPPIVIETTSPPTTAPETTVPETTVPETTVPAVVKHTVRDGDTLWGIAVKYANGRDIDAYLQLLIKENPVVLPAGTNSTLLPGEELIIP